MSYEKTGTWEKGMLISSLKLNHIEDGIVALDTTLTNTRTSLGSSATYGIVDTQTSGEAEDLPALSSLTDDKLITARLVRKAINNMDYADEDAASDKFVSSVVQEDGKVDAVHTAFAPSITFTDGTTKAAPKFKITINNNSTTDSSITIATEGTNGIYGVTRLSNTPSASVEDMAATPKGVQNAIDLLDVDNATSGDGNHITGFAQSNTLATLIQTNGIISATFQGIQIAENQVTDLNTHLDLKAPLASPALTGTPTAPTASDGTNSTQIATTAFVMNTLRYADAMIFKGVVNSDNDLPATHDKGWTYKVATAGTYAENICEVGDLIVCINDATVASSNDWAVIQNNVDGAIFKGANVFTDEHILIADGTSGKIKDSTKVISDFATAGHTHETTIATSTGTNQITLAYGSKYSITAGGTSYIFTMPNAYGHPTPIADPTQETAGVFKITVDRDGHVLTTDTASAADIGALPSTTTAADLGALTSTDPTITITPSTGGITFSDGTDTVKFTMTELKALHDSLSTT